MTQLLDSEGHAFSAQHRTGTLRRSDDLRSRAATAVREARRNNASSPSGAEVASRLGIFASGGQRVLGSPTAESEHQAKVFGHDQMTVPNSS